MTSESGENAAVDNPGSRCWHGRQCSGTGPDCGPDIEPIAPGDEHYYETRAARG